MRRSNESSQPSLASSAAKRLRQRRRHESTEPEAVDFFAAVPTISPQYSEPRWLDPLVSVIKRSFLASAGLGPPVFALVSVPPQHGKTLTIQSALAWWIRHRPQDALLYSTYNRDVAREKNREIRDFALLAGAQVRDDSRSLDTWTTTEGGGVRARGLVGGALTGTSALRWIVVDDPYKGRKEAESAAYRRDVWQSFSANIVSRLHKTTSVLVNHTRWFDLDLIGRLKKEQPGKWEVVNLPALNERGEALWPDGQPIELLKDKRERGGEYDWWSLYMGEPRPRDGKLFGGVAYFHELPSVVRIAIGVDLAYSSKTASDWSVAVVMAECNGQFFVLEVLRKQCELPAFAFELNALARRYPRAPMVSYVANYERRNVDTLLQFGVPLIALPASGDKYTRAQPLAAAWKSGRVALRAGAEWIDEYADVILGFTGVGGDDEQDDDVDATASAFDALGGGHVVKAGSTKVPDAVKNTRTTRDRSLRSRKKSSW